MSVKSFVLEVLTFLSLHASLWRPVNCKEFSFLPSVCDLLMFRAFSVFILFNTNLCTNSVCLDVLLVYICAFYVYNGLFWP